jgi:hypothetical protein
MTNPKCLAGMVPDTFSARSAHLTGLKMMLITRAVSFDHLIGQQLYRISIPRTEANVIKPFQARMPLWSGSVRHRSVQTKKKRRVYWPRGSVARSSCRTISKGERSITAMAGTPAQEEIDEPTGKFLRPRSEIAHFELLA